MYLIHGKWFYGLQDTMFAHAADAVIYIKFDKNRFTSFDSLDAFWEWYFRAREACRKEKKAFPVFEILHTGNNMCFIADLEVYLPPETDSTQLQKIEYTIKNLFRAAYDRHADAENLVITQNSRVSAYKKTRGGEKQPGYKISLHFLERSEIFNEMHKKSAMSKLAIRVNQDLVAEMKDLVAKHDIFLPGGDVLDLGIYTKNRAMSLIGTAKEYGQGAFALTEESKHVPIRDCIVTQQIGGDVSYFELPPELKESGDQESPKKKTNRNVPIKRPVAKPATRETSETERLLRDYLQTEYGDAVTVKYNGEYGGQSQYEVRGDRAFCPCCKDNHQSNGAYVKHTGGMFFLYKCLNPSAPREVELDLRGFQREPSPSQASKYLPPFWHVKSKVISISSGMGTGKTTQIIADKDHMKPKRALVVTCRRGMATNMTGRVMLR